MKIKVHQLFVKKKRDFTEKKIVDCSFVLTIVDDAFIHSQTFADRHKTAKFTSFPIFLRILLICSYPHTFADLLRCCLSHKGGHQSMH